MTNENDHKTNGFSRLSRELESVRTIRLRYEELTNQYQDTKTVFHRSLAREERRLRACALNLEQELDPIYLTMHGYISNLKALESHLEGMIKTGMPGPDSAGTSMQDYLKFCDEKEKLYKKLLRRSR